MSTRPKLVVAVAEDSERAWLARSLADVYRVEVAATGKEALRAAEHIDADVMICAQALPDLAGSEVCLRLRQTHPRMRMLVLIDPAFAGMSESTLRASLHADGVLTRPLRFKRVAERLREWGLPVGGEELTVVAPLVDNDFTEPKPRGG